MTFSTRPYRIGDTVIAFNGPQELTAMTHLLHQDVRCDDTVDLQFYLSYDESLLSGPSWPTIHQSDHCYHMAYSGWRAEFNTQTKECHARLNPRVPAKRQSKWIESLIRIVFGKWIQLNHGLSFHGAAMVKNGLGYLFLGASGTGKTTVVRQWPGEHVLSDDHAIVRRTKDGFRLFGTPYSGRENTPCEPGEHAPLQAILLLNQDQCTTLSALSAAQSFQALLPHVIHIPSDRRDTDRVLAIIQDLCASVTVANLHFNRIDPLWPVVQQVAA